MTMSHRPVDRSGKTRQVPIPLGRELTKDVLMSLAEGLLKGVESEGNAYPCAVLSLQVAGFEERELGNMGIAGFLVKGDQAKAVSKERVEAQQDEDRTVKRRRLDTGIGKFFRKGSEDLENENIDTLEWENLRERDGDMMDAEDASINILEEVEGEVDDALGKEGQSTGYSINDLPAHDTYTCSRCGTGIRIQDQEEHEDWHFAKALADEDRAATRERIAAVAASLQSVPGNSKKGGVSKKGGSGSGKGSKKGGMEKGQKKLAFGN